MMGISSKLQARGLRNNNPGNLRMSNIKWVGKIPNAKNTDGVYEQFTTAHYGLRAMYMDLKNDIEKDGTNTPRKLIKEYAPQSDNNPTQKYINYIANALLIGPDDLIQTTPAHYTQLMKAIIKFENGEQPYSDGDIIAAIRDGVSR